MSSDTGSVGGGPSGAGGAGGPTGSESTGSDDSSPGAEAGAAASEAPDTSADDVGDTIAGTDGVDEPSSGDDDAQAAADEAAATAEEATMAEIGQAAADEADAIAEMTAEEKAKDDAQAAADEAAMTAEIAAEKHAMAEIGQAAADEADAIAEIAAEKNAMAEIGQAAADEADAIAEMTAEKKAKDDAQAAADEAAKIASIAADLGVKAEDLAALVDDAKKAETTSSHTVVAGDTLGHIAASHGVSLSDVLAQNPQITDPNHIDVGQQIDLPAGAQKTDVAAAQSALAAAGYAVGPIDGIAGPKTEAAVRSFQRANGLKATGLIDGPTAKALSAPTQTPTTPSIAGPTAVTAASTPGPLGALLDRIALGEGTGQAKAAKHGFKSGYDVTLGYGAYTPSSLKGKNLTDMTLAEVKQLQSGILNNPKNPHNSSAVGRYQIVGETLRGLQRQMGIPDSARFTPELQDRMAARLVEGRGLKSFQSGRLSARGFQANLAKEWASIASPRTGRSHYGQATGTSTAQIQALLSGLRR